MATENLNTYTLSPTIAASLRVPRINYPNDVVPGDVLSRVTGHPEVDTHISELDALLNKRLASGVN